MTNEQILKIVRSQIGELIDMIDSTIQPEYEIIEGDIKSINVTIEGEDLGFMIGSNGRHLDSLQFVLSFMVNRALEKQEDGLRVYLNVDVGNYKADQIEKLKAYAKAKADDARILGEPIDLEPMSAGDRRIVHTALQDSDDITTESHGEEPTRFVRIIPKSEDDLGLINREDNDKTEETESESEE